MRYVAFLRAINVGGRVVRMERLRAIFEAEGLANVATFIASGNVFFESKKPAATLEGTIEQALARELGYEVATMLRTPKDLAAAVAHVETERMDAKGIVLYVGFLKTAPAPAATRAVSALSNDADTLSVRGRELYWQCRRTLSRSTITGARLEKLLNVPMTLRNVSTVRRLAS